LKKDFKLFCNNLKKSRYGSRYLRFYIDKEIIEFHPLTFNSVTYKNIIRLKQWRQKNKKYFYSKNYITFNTTQEYIRKYINSERLRIIFFIKYKKYFIGHLELTNLSSNNKNLEITYILRGVKSFKGKMSVGISSISNFIMDYFKFNNLFIKVESNNSKAINFYKCNNYYFYKKYKKILTFRFDYKKNNKKIKFDEIIK
jgi:RimJ/RimL family protein N-acetyltransferase